MITKTLSLGKQNMMAKIKKLESRRKPARIPPQTPPAGGKSAEAGQIHSPRQIVSPCLVRISIFNHLDFARNSFELCPTNTANEPVRAFSFAETEHNNCLLCVGIRTPERC